MNPKDSRKLDGLFAALEIHINFVLFPNVIHRYREMICRPSLRTSPMG